MYTDGTVSESVDEPTCAAGSCGQSVVPGTSYCGVHQADGDKAQGAPSGGPDGSLSDGTQPSTDPNSGWSDGTLRGDNMTVEDIRLAAYLAEVRAKYSEKDKESLGKKGHAFKNPDGSYSFPISDSEDLSNAIHAVGRSGSSHDAVRKYIIGRAKDLGKSDEIPDNWNSDGSIKESDSQEVETETRDADSDVLGALQDAAEAVETAQTAQGQDPDEDDPDDAAVEQALENLEDAVDDALQAQQDDMSGDDAWSDQNRSDRVAEQRKPRHRSAPSPREEVRESMVHFGLNDLHVAEIRSGSGKDGKIVLEGTPIVYNRSYDVHDQWGVFRETMNPSVCDGVLASTFHLDCRFLFNHDGIPLARTTSGTLELVNSRDGLKCVADLDARQSLANDVAIAIERGDISQMSCGFIVADDEWNDTNDQRTIHRFAELLDVSAVTYPASPTTHIALTQRMLQSLPVESRARIRQAYMLMNEIRAGRAFNKDSAQIIMAALEALHNADDLDPQEFADRAAALASSHRAARDALSSLSGSGLELEPGADNADIDEPNGAVTDPGESIRSEDESRELRRKAIQARRDRMARKRYLG